MKKLFGIMTLISLIVIILLTSFSCSPVNVMAVPDKNDDQLNDVVVPNWDTVEKLGQEFTLPVGQNAAISGEDMFIRFVEVISDSRSPKGAETIWAGEAKCRIRVTYHGATSEVTLTERGAMEGFSQVSLLQYKLNFQLKPYPEVGYQPASSDYSLIMKITR